MLLSPWLTYSGRNNSNTCTCVTLVRKYRQTQVIKKTQTSLSTGIVSTQIALTALKNSPYLELFNDCNCSLTTTIYKVS